MASCVVLAIAIAGAPTEEITIWCDIGSTQTIHAHDVPFCDVSNCHNFEIQIPLSADELVIVGTNQAGDMQIVWPNEMAKSHLPQSGRLRLTAEDVFTHAPPVTDVLVLHLFQLGERDKVSLAAIMARRSIRQRQQLGDDTRFSDADLALFKWKPDHGALVIERPDFRKLTRHMRFESRAKAHLKSAINAQRRREFRIGADEANAALTEIERAFPLKYFPRGHEDIVVMLIRKADSKAVMGEFEEAHTWLAKAKAVIDSAFEDRHSDAQALSVGAYYFHVAKFKYKEGHFQECIDNAEKCRMELKSVQADKVSAAAFEYMTSAQLFQSMSIAELRKDDPVVSRRWDKVIAKSRGNDNLPAVVRERTQASVLLMYGDYLESDGQFKKAIEVCERVVGIANRLPVDGGLDLGAEARLVSARGLAALGDFGESLRHIDDARERSQKFRGDGPIAGLHQASELFGLLAQCSVFLSNPKLVERHIPIIERQLAGFHPKLDKHCAEYLYTSLALAAVLDERQGNVDSTTVIRRGIARTEKYINRDGAELGIAYLQLANAELLKGRILAARSALEQSTRYYPKPSVATAFRSLICEARIARALKERDLAMKLIAKCESYGNMPSLGALDRWRAAQLGRLLFSESGQHAEAARYAQRSFDLYIEHLEELVSQTNSAEYQGKRRVAKMMLDTLLADGIQAEVSPNELRLAVRRFYQTDFSIAPAKRGEQDVLLTRQSELETIWQAALLRSPESNEDDKTTAALLEISRLQRGTLFIPEPPKNAVEPLKGKRRQSEWLIHRMQRGDESFLVVFQQNEDAEKDEKNRMMHFDGNAFDKNLRTWRQKVIDRADSDKELKWMSEKLSPLLENVVGHLQVVGDPIAYEIPWAALWVGERPFVERASVAVSQMPGTPRPPADIHPETSIMLIGDVRFPADGPLERLPFSRDEVLKIGAQFAAPSLALGATATRKWTLDTLAKTEVAHLATHGIGRSTVRSLGQGKSPLLAEAPFLGSGLLLAGGTPDRADLLTAATVASLQLPQLKLVVLSACESGVTAGDELGFALPRAFHMAGTRTVVSTQWPVDDQATSVLMQLFYTNLVAEEMRPAEALRQAQLTILKHPTRVEQLAKLRGPDFTKAAQKLRKDSPKEKVKKNVSPRLWAGFVVSHGGEVGMAP